MVYAFPSYVPAIAIVVSVVAAMIGAVLVGTQQPVRYYLAAFFVSVLAGGIFAPMLAMDRVVLDDEKLEQTTGFWFSPTVKGFRLADVALVTITTAHDRKGR